MTRQPPSLRAAMLAVLILVCCYSPSAHTQVPDIIAHPENYEFVQDGVYVKRIDKSGRIIGPEEKIATAYRFEMIYDSTSRVQYLFTECMCNGMRPRLLAWRNKHLHCASTTMMTDSSRTENFHIKTGDTVSFFREFKWYNPETGRQDTNNFWSPDTLGYAIELVSAATGSRLVLLDSFGVLAQLTPGPPAFYGTKPIMTTVKYVVPTTIPTTDSVFVRVRLYTNGDGLYLPVRHDEWTIGASYALDIGIWNYYLSLYGGSLSKRSLNDFNPASAASSRPSLTVSTIASGSVQIQFSSPSASGPVQIVIYDAVGTPVFVPFASRGSVDNGTALYNFTSSGTYFVTLQRNGAIVDVKKINIAL